MFEWIKVKIDDLAVRWVMRRGLVARVTKQHTENVFSKMMEPIRKLGSVGVAGLPPVKLEQGEAVPFEGLSEADQDAVRKSMKREIEKANGPIGVVIPTSEEDIHHTPIYGFSRTSVGGGMLADGTWGVYPNAESELRKAGLRRNEAEAINPFRAPIRVDGIDYLDGVEIKEGERLDVKCASGLYAPMIGGKTLNGQTVVINKTLEGNTACVVVEGRPIRLVKPGIYCRRSVEASP